MSQRVPDRQEMLGTKRFVFFGTVLYKSGTQLGARRFCPSGRISQCLEVCLCGFFGFFFFFGYKWGWGHEILLVLNG